MLSELNPSKEKRFKEIFLCYYDKVLSVALKYTKDKQTAEDILQQVFMKLWKNESILYNLNNTDAYLYKMVRNEIIDELRKKSLKEKTLHHTNLSQIQETPEDMLFEKDTAILIHEAINRLPEKQKLVYLMSRDEGLNHKEIAEKMNISVHTVKWHIVHAIQSIKTVLYQSHRENLVSFILPIVFIIFS